VFTELAAQVQEEEQGLGEVAAALAELDATAGLAELARAEGYTRPRVDDSQAFEIRGGRHPVVEQALKAARAGPFIENDCVLGRADIAPAPGFDETAEGRIWLKSEASIRMAEGLGLPWSLAAGFRVLPLRLRDAVYSFVARNRFRVAGRRAVCYAPPTEFRDRFIG